MDTPHKNTAQRVRYTDTQKKEIVDFVTSHNAANGRGGQTAASAQFKVSPISVAAWMNAAGATNAPKGAKAVKVAKKTKTTQAAKATKATKTTPVAKAPKIDDQIEGKADDKIKAATRYTAEQKKEVVDFVTSYNAENGRGGQSTAALKFNVSPITVMSWLKAAGANNSSKKAVKTSKTAKVAKAPQISSSGGIDGKLATLLALSKEIASAEAALAQLKGKFSSLKASL